jgi:hypothetical protein
MIGRRAMLLAGTVLVARRAIAGLPIPRGNSLSFRIVRHNSEIGTHIVNFERDGDTLKVQTTIDVLVTVLSIPLARYQHRSSEIWQGMSLVGLAGETTRDGRHDWMNAHRTDAGLVVLGSQTTRYIAPDTATPVSYWNKRMLHGPMISLEDGVLSSPAMANLHTDKVLLASGSMILANHYRLSNPIDTDVWYDETDTWVAMLMTVVDGSQIRYERL